MSVVWHETSPNQKVTGRPCHGKGARSGQDSDMNVQATGIALHLRRRRGG